MGVLYLGAQVVVAGRPTAPFFQTLAPSWGFCSHCLLALDSNSLSFRAARYFRAGVLGLFLTNVTAKHVWSRVEMPGKGPACPPTTQRGTREAALCVGVLCRTAVLVGSASVHVFNILSRDWLHLCTRVLCLVFEVVEKERAGCARAVWRGRRKGEEEGQSGVKYHTSYGLFMFLSASLQPVPFLDPFAHLRPPFLALSRS